MSDVATTPRTAMPPNIFTSPGIRSSRATIRRKAGAGATLMRRGSICPIAQHRKLARSRGMFKCRAQIALRGGPRPKAPRDAECRTVTNRTTLNAPTVDAITRTLAKELGPRMIRVNAISPGVVATEGTHASGIIGGEFEQLAISQTPLGRIAQTEDIAPVALFLASDDSRWITGEILYVTGRM